MGSHHKPHYFFLLGSMAFMLSSTTASATLDILGTYSYTIAPYFGALLTDSLSIDFTESDVYFWIKAINGNLAI